MAQILDYDPGAELDDDRKPWNGSHNTPRMSLWLFLANSHRINYPWSAYDGATLCGGTLTLYFLNATVTVVGRHLKPLAALVGNQGVWYIREQHVSPFEATDDDPFVDSITLSPPDPAALSHKP